MGILVVEEKFVRTTQNPIVSWSDCGSAKESTCQIRKTKITDVDAPFAVLIKMEGSIVGERLNTSRGYFLFFSRRDAWYLEVAGNGRAILDVILWDLATESDLGSNQSGGAIRSGPAPSGISASANESSDDASIGGVGMLPVGRE